MPWTCEPTETVRETETEPEEEQAPQPQKTWKNSARQGTVSLATSKATWHRIAQINPQTTNQLPRKGTLKPTKPLSQTMKHLTRTKLTMEAHKQTPGFVKVRSSQSAKKKTWSAWHGKWRLECWLVLMRIFKDGNPVSLGVPAKTRIEEHVC